MASSNAMVTEAPGCTRALSLGRPLGALGVCRAHSGTILGLIFPPELDLEDPQVQENLRQLSVPARFVDQVLGVGRAAERAAAQIQVPTLIIQGTQDQAVRPARTRQMLQRLPGPITYEELETDHGLVEADNPGFQQMTQSVLAFAGGVATARNP